MSKTVKIRVPVGLTSGGFWFAAGMSDWPSAEAHAAVVRAVDVGASSCKVIYWLTAELPIPEPVEVEAEVD